MDPEVKRQLDLKLAKGEISIGEYEGRMLGEQKSGYGLVQPERKRLQIKQAFTSWLLWSSCLMVCLGFGLHIYAVHLIKQDRDFKERVAQTVSSGGIGMGILRHSDGRTEPIRQAVGRWIYADANERELSILFGTLGWSLLWLLALLMSARSLLKTKRHLSETF
jgi:hypothetical protein